ncbi:hypothetical protein R1flu_008334 [Riccia fluitans]|uniref:Uncharacterized protein n=1 Tax=Riccia fluitans TaxID=41844 RepID=A0ABD1YBE4_9MARC
MAAYRSRDVHCASLGRVTDVQGSDARRDPVANGATAIALAVLRCVDYWVTMIIPIGVQTLQCGNQTRTSKRLSGSVDLESGFSFQMGTSSVPLRVPAWYMQPPGMLVSSKRKQLFEDFGTWYFRKMKGRIAVSIWVLPLHDPLDALTRDRSERGLGLSSLPYATVTPIRFRSGVSTANEPAFVMW